MKKLETFLKVFIFVQLGACAGRILYRYIDYCLRPLHYAIMSAPWYTDCIVNLVLTAITAGITAIVYGIVRHKNKRACADK